MTGSIGGCLPDRLHCSSRSGDLLTVALSQAGMPDLLDGGGEEILKADAL
jgi:hypothetical protein